MKISVLDSFSRAFKHTEKFLFKPFNLTRWLKLGFISFFISSGGWSGFNFNFNNGKHDHHEKTFSGFASSNNLDAEIFKQKLLALLNSADLPALILIISSVVLAVSVLYLIFLWLRGVFNFVLMDDIVKNEDRVVGPFHNLKPKGNSLFLWYLGFGSVSLAIFILFLPFILYNIYIIVKFHCLANIFWLIFCVILFLLIALVLAVIGIINDDFVVPVMYAENVKILESWKLVRPRLKGNFGNIAAYVLLKIVIAIGQAVIGLIAAFACLIIVGIPAILLILIGAFFALALKLTWTIITLTITGIFALAFIAAIIYVMSVLLMPVEVFRRTFALDLVGQMDEKWNLLKISYPQAPGKTPN